MSEQNQYPEISISKDDVKQAENTTVQQQQQQQNTSQNNNNTNNNDNDDDIDPSSLCKACHKAPIEYAPSSCRHPLFCKKCAMKVATGGKCKVCGQMFPDLKRV